MIRSSRCSLLSVVGLILPVACAALRPPPATGPEARQEVREMVGSLEARAESLRGLKGLASVRYGGSLLGATGQAVFLIQRPSSLRVDGLSAFGFYDYQLGIVNGGLTVYWGGPNRYRKGLATREELAEYLSLSLEPESAIDLLVGVVPLEEAGAYGARVRKGGGVILTGERTEVVLVREEGGMLPIRFREWDAGGALRYDVSYGDWRWEGVASFPREVTARFHEPRSKISVRFLTVELNPALDGGDFRIPIPSDAEPL